MKRLILLSILLITALGVNAFSKTKTTSPASTGTTTAAIYNIFLNTYATHEGVLSDCYSEYDTWGIAKSIDREGDIDHRYYLIRPGHENDNIQITRLSESVQNQFNNWLAAGKKKLTVNIFSNYLNNAIMGIQPEERSGWYAEPNVINYCGYRYDNRAIRGQFPDQKYQQIFDEADAIASLMNNNWNHLDFNPLYGPSVNFDLQGDSDNTTYSPSITYVLSSGQKILDFSSKILSNYNTHSVPSSAPISPEIGDQVVSPDLSLEFDSLDGTQSVAQPLNQRS